MVASVRPASSVFKRTLPGTLSTSSVRTPLLRPRTVTPSARVTRPVAVFSPCPSRSTSIGASSAAGSVLGQSRPRRSVDCAASSSDRNSVAPSNNSDGVFWLLLINFAVFLAGNVLGLPGVRALYLYGSNPHWWQFVTSAFCHASWEHLSGNAFMLYIFGKIVEEEEGAFGVWATYIICAVGGSLASLMLSPGSASTVYLGASGAVFGMFGVSVLLKLRPNIKSLLESFILGQFVLKQVMGELSAQMAGGKMIGGGLQVGHLAHLGGALTGVVLIFLLTRIPEPEG